MQKNSQPVGGNQSIPKVFCILDKLFRIFVITACLLGVLVGAISILFRDRRPKIYFAAEAGDTNYIAQHLALGSNVNSSIISYRYGVFSSPLLHIAVSGGHPDAVDFLLKRGANPNQFDHANTPLTMAVSIGSDRGDVSSQIIRMLIKGGADPNLNTPLLHAASLGRIEVVRALLAEGADVGGTNSGGQTALHMSVPHAEVAKMLLAAGANPNARDESGATPVDYAARDACTDTLAVLTNALVRTNR